MTREKNIYALKATPELVKLTTVTKTYRVITEMVELEGEEIEEGMPSEVEVEAREQLVGVTTSNLWMDVVDVDGFQHFVEHIESLAPAQTNFINYETVENWKEIRVQNNDVFYVGGFADAFIEELGLTSVTNWDVSHPSSNEDGEFFCEEFEDLVNFITANGRSTEIEMTEAEETKVKRKALGKYYHLLPATDTTDAIRNRIVELYDFETPITFTAEELAILEG